MLALKNISISYENKKVVDAFSMQVNKGEILSIVGESGSGKTSILKAIMGLLTKKTQVTGEIYYKAVPLLQKKSAYRNALRGKEIAMVFQDAGLSLNPLRKIGSQFIQYIQNHISIGTKEAYAVAIDMLEKMHLSNGADIMQSYIFNLSGGMKQRVGLAMAMALKPSVLLLDEPTSALDVTTQAQIVEEILHLRDTFTTSIVLVTHNIPLAIYMSERIIVMKKGNIVEEGAVSEILYSAQHHYTQELLANIPSMEDFTYAKQ